jgi:type I restriction enzyme S subunit
MTESKTKPEIRFTGFTDAWEQRKLGDVADKVTEKNTGRPYSETLTNSAEFGIISQREFFDKDISNEENIDGYYIVRNDDFVYNPRISTFAPVGPIKRNKLGRNGIMSPLYYVFRTHDIDPTYLEHFFTTTGWHKFMKLNGDSGARSDRFSIKDSVFREMPLPYPSLTEQKQIGSFFALLDHLITLHQREYNKTVNIKKAMLKKMFPKDGEDKPEIRFTGFTDAWEQRRLGEIAQVITRTDSESTAPVMMISASSGFINQSEKYSSDNAGQSLAKYILLKKGELAYNHGASKYKPYGSCFALNADGARVPFVYHCFEVGENNPNFTAIVLNDSRVDKQLRRLVSSGARMDGLLNISFDSYKTVEIMLPQKAEQDKINEFFAALDTLLTLHQRELGKLQNMKKALLDKMFV